MARENVPISLATTNRQWKTFVGGHPKRPPCKNQFLLGHPEVTCLQKWFLAKKNENPYPNTLQFRSSYPPIHNAIPPSQIQIRFDQFTMRFCQECCRRYPNAGVVLCSVFLRTKSKQHTSITSAREGVEASHDREHDEVGCLSKDGCDEVDGWELLDAGLCHVWPTRGGFMLLRSHRRDYRCRALRASSWDRFAGFGTSVARPANCGCGQRWWRRQEGAELGRRGGCPKIRSRKVFSYSSSIFTICATPSPPPRFNANSSTHISLNMV